MRPNEALRATLGDRAGRSVVLGPAKGRRKGARLGQVRFTVNVLKGYRVIDIFSPAQVIDYGDS